MKVLNCLGHVSLGLWVLGCLIQFPTAVGSQAEDTVPGNGIAVTDASDSYLLPDANNPDYVYVNDFETMPNSGELAHWFDMRATNGYRKGAGYRSPTGFSTLIAENKSLPAYPQVPFPLQTGVFFVHFNMKTPKTFYLGRATHAYYIRSTKGRGSVVLDGAVDHPAWLDPEWDPHTVFTVYDARGYQGIVDPFEGMEPKRRGYRQILWMSF